MYPVAPRVTPEQITEFHRRAHQLRARTFRLFGILLRRAVRRATARAVAWLRHRLDEAPPISPWLRHRF